MPGPQRLRCEALLSRFALAHCYHVFSEVGRSQSLRMKSLQGFMFSQPLHHLPGDGCHTDPDLLCIPGREMYNYSILTGGTVMGSYFF